MIRKEIGKNNTTRRRIMLTVRKRKYRSGKKAWYADFTVRGTRYRVALNASNKALATKEAQKLHDEILKRL